MEPFALYTHIPFCISKCKYCDFYSTCVKDIPQLEYFEALKKELKFQSQKNIWKNRQVQSIYFGGGTPSLIEPSFYKDFIDTVKDNFEFQENAEFTLEANPKTISREKLFGYKEAGINRISLGVQSFNDDILRMLGRVHNANDVLESVSLIKKAGFNNISLDLIYGIPGQKIIDVERDLSEIKKIDVSHISFYSLIIEPHTAFGLMKEKGLLKECEDEAFVKMDNEICNSLENFGFSRYEISNYAKKNKESIHNLAYWNSTDFLGLGANAFSGFMQYKDNVVSGNVRYSNVRSFKKYIECTTSDFNNLSAFYEKNDFATAMFEYIMMALRKVKTGIDLKDFKEKFAIDFCDVYENVLEKLRKENLVDISKENVKIKKDKILISNSIIEEFL